MNGPLLQAPREDVGDESGPITPASGALIALVGVFAFCALLVLFTYASNLETGDNGGGHALSRSAIGFSGLAAGLRDLGEPVLVSRHKLPAGRTAGIYVLTPPLAALDRNVTPMGFGGPVLTVLPKWDAVSDPSRRGWVAPNPFTPGGLAPTRALPPETLLAKAHVARRPGEGQAILRALDNPFGAGQMLRTGPIKSFQTMDLKGWRGWTPVMVDETGATVMAKAPWGPVYLISDPDLLDNQGLKDLTGFSTALAIVNQMRANGGPVIFDVTLNGLGGQRSALNLLFDPPFLAVTLCLAAAAALAGWQAFCRFGPARRGERALAFGKQALTDNTAALAKLAGKETAMGEPYAALTRDLAARAVGAPRTLTDDALTEFLDRLARRKGSADGLGYLAVVARTASDRGRLLAAARQLYRWRMEMTREG
ncbi:MAG TPA: hypothetical protein VG227_10815 [Caulobacteraceae bacterium]|nr:hypothetical protein [Caulobacteraceae bacterium]